MRTVQKFEDTDKQVKKQFKEWKGDMKHAQQQQKYKKQFYEMNDELVSMISGFEEYQKKQKKSELKGNDNEKLKENQIKYLSEMKVNLDKTEEPDKYKIPPQLFSDFRKAMKNLTKLVKKDGDGKKIEE